MNSKELNRIISRLLMREKRHCGKPMTKEESIVYKYINDMRLLRLRLYNQLNIKDEKNGE